jgi:hypothetical protein
MPPGPGLIEPGERSGVVLAAKPIRLGRENFPAAVLNVLSVRSWLSLPATGAYRAAKSAEWSLTNSFRQGLAGVLPAVLDLVAVVGFRQRVAARANGWMRLGLPERQGDDKRPRSLCRAGQALY